MMRLGNREAMRGGSVHAVRHMLCSDTDVMHVYSIAGALIGGDIQRPFGLLLACRPPLCRHLAAPRGQGTGLEPSAGPRAKMANRLGTTPWPPTSIFLSICVMQMKKLEVSVTITSPFQIRTLAFLVHTAIFPLKSMQFIITSLHSGDECKGTSFNET